METENAETHQGFRQTRSFVQRSGRISPAQKRSYDTLFSRYGIDGKVLPFPALEEIFANDHPVVIEIGFGMGRATAAIALKNPGINYLAIDVHKPGIGRLLGDIEKFAIGNLRIVEGDAAEILTQIKDDSVSAFHIFFPDPWPKKRHHKRRLIKRPFTDLLAAKLVPGAYIYMVSDWADYGDWALRELTATLGLFNKYVNWAEGLTWRPLTEFEKKGLYNNHEIRELYFEKRKS